jgi:hypothetical protein
MYTLIFRIRNCRVRNVATEALDLFKEISEGHVDHMRK